MEISEVKMWRQLREVISPFVPFAEGQGTVDFHGNETDSLPWKRKNSWHHCSAEVVKARGSNYDIITSILLIIFSPLVMIHDGLGLGCFSSIAHLFGLVQFCD